MLPQVSVFTADGIALDVGAWLTMQTAAQGARTIHLGSAQHLGCRLLWERVPEKMVMARRAAAAQDAIDRAARRRGGFCVQSMPSWSGCYYNTGLWRRVAGR